jgi:hypothetical protein
MDCRRNEKTEKDPADDAALDPAGDHIVNSQQGPVLGRTGYLTDDVDSAQLTHEVEDRNRPRCVVPGRSPRRCLGLTDRSSPRFDLPTEVLLTDPAHHRDSQLPWRRSTTRRREVGRATMRWRRRSTCLTADGPFRTGWSKYVRLPAFFASQVSD